MLWCVLRERLGRVRDSLRDTIQIRSEIFRIDLCSKKDADHGNRDINQATQRGYATTYSNSGQKDVDDRRVLHGKACFLKGDVVVTPGYTEDTAECHAHRHQGDATGEHI